MKELILTCPFTGAEFTAHEYPDGKIEFIHPLTGEALFVNWNCSIKKYNVPRMFFEHIETMTPNEAAKELDVTPQRISQIMKDEIIPVRYINNSPVFLAQDVHSYKKTRKVGAPKKVKNW